MSLRRGSSKPTAEGPDPPPIGVRDLPRPSGPPTRVEPAYRRGGIRGRHVSRGRGRESSAGRLAHPPHSMRVVEACSAAAARGAAFVRPHCRPHITEVHSAAACAASYTARSATLQATPQATPWCRFDKTGHDYAGRKIPTGRARKSRNEIFSACNAIMFEQYVILYYIVGPTCRGPNGHVQTSLEI